MCEGVSSEEYKSDEGLEVMGYSSSPRKRLASQALSEEGNDDGGEEEWIGCDSAKGYGGASSSGLG